MSNQTNEVWEELYWENKTIIVGNSGWLVILTLIVIRLTLKLLRPRNNQCSRFLGYFKRLTLKIL